MERQKKEKVVQEVGSKLRELKYLFLAEYSGMTVAQITRLRRELRNVDTEFTVIKNSLLKIASKGTRAEVLQDKFDGPNAIISIHKDSVQALRALSRVLQKKFPV